MTSKKKTVVETTQPKVIYIGPSIRGLNSYSVFEKEKFPFPVSELIKKYPNRRLYDTEISSYITIEDVEDDK